MLRSHVDAVAVHLHPAKQPCLNLMVIPLG